MRPVRRADNMTIFMCRLSENNLNLLESSGPVQDCTRFALYLYTKTLDKGQDSGSEYETHQNILKMRFLSQS
jgi:hypothetical protein